MNYVVGVDIGTQGTKTRLYNEEGHCLGSGFAASRLRRPRAGVVEEDPENQLESVRHTLRVCVRQAGVPKQKISALAIAGQMAGIIGVDKHGRHITPYDSWLDTRCTKQIDEMERKAGAEILAKTGCAPGFNHGPKL